MDLAKYLNDEIAKLTSKRDELAKAINETQNRLDSANRAHQMMEFNLHTLNGRHQEVISQINELVNKLNEVKSDQSG